MLDSEGGLVRSGHPGSLQGEPWVGGGGIGGGAERQVLCIALRSDILFSL